MNESAIFRAYDIRGVYGQELDEEAALLVGKAVGTYAGDGKYVAVGRDVRLSSDSLHEKVVEGIISTGCNVVDFGIIPTPLLYFGVNHENLSGGIMITASHLPPEWNGFKIVKEKGFILSDGTGLENIHNIFTKRAFATATTSGKVADMSILDKYKRFCVENIPPGKRLSVVLDYANSVTSLVAGDIIRKLGFDVHEINKELDGTFPNRASEPSEESLQGLKKEVLERKADIGIGYDGDGDRVAFVDERGRIFASGDVTIPILTKHLMGRKGPGKVVLDVTCSLAMADYLKNLGAEPIVVRTGHGYCVQAVLENNALIGGQFSGHIALPDANCADDAIYASLILLDALVSSSAKLSELVDSVPSYSTTKMELVECPDSEKFGVMEKVRGLARKLDYDKLEIDGVKLIGDDGGVLIRASNTSPFIRISAEGKTKEKAEEFHRTGKTLLVEAMGA